MTPSAPEDALFVPDGDRLVPTEAARGPWAPDALHGGPVAALLARTVESLVPDEPMHVSRLTVELLRPVPLAPLSVSASFARPGRKVQFVDARISDGERDVAWARALRIRIASPGSPQGQDEETAEPAPAALGPIPGSDPGAPPGPEDGYASLSPPSAPTGLSTMPGPRCAMWWATSTTRGPATVWVRLAVPVVPGEAPTPLQRVAAAADFGNGVSSELDFVDNLFINPDLSVHLHRPARGEWVCLDASTRLGIPGVGVAQSALWDVHGPIGRSIQSLLIEKRA